MELTKQQRHIIYKTARQSLMDEIDKNTMLKKWCSMCFHLHCAFIKITGKEVESCRHMCLMLKEFDSLKPDGCFYSDYWWDKNDYVTRIEKFNELIEMTKP